MTILTPQAFVATWRFVQLKERSAYQEHFIDLFPWPTGQEPSKTKISASLRGSNPERSVAKSKGSDEAISLSAHEIASHPSTV